MRVRELTLTALAFAFAILWVGGLVSYLVLKGPPAASRWAAPAFLALSGIIVLVSAQAADRMALLGWGILGWSVELLGVHTGIPFGRYQYTGVLFPLVAGVPVAMGCAWIVLLAYVQQMMIGWTLPEWARPLLGAIWMTAIDLVMEPLAVGQLGYWRWSEGGSYYGVPLSNFTGWFLVSLALFLLYRRPMVANVWARWIGASVILFFTILALGSSLVLPAMMGVILSVLHAGFSLSAARHLPAKAGRSR
jgi:putative membrane protein